MKTKNILLGLFAGSLVSARKLKVQSSNQITCSDFIIAHADRSVRHEHISGN